MKETILTQGQLYAFQQAAKYFDYFCDKIKFESNSIVDGDMGELIRALSYNNQVKQLAISRNDLKENSLEQLKELL